MTKMSITNLRRTQNKSIYTYSDLTKILSTVGGGGVRGKAGARGPCPSPYINCAQSAKSYADAHGRPQGGQE